MLTFTEKEISYLKNYLNTETSESVKSVFLLAEGIADLGIEMQHDLTRCEDPSIWEVISEDTGPPALANRSMKAAFFRGELPIVCTCMSGRASQILRHRKTEQEIRLVESAISHRNCGWQAWYQSKMKDTPLWQSKVHDSHRVHSLAPYARSPLSKDVQQSYIDLLPELVENINRGEQRSWVILGPPGTGKTSYVTALFMDLHTGRAVNDEFRYAQQRNPSLLEYKRNRNKRRSFGLWRVRVASWLADVWAYETRPFDSEIVEPETTVEKIKAEFALSGVAPMVWLEEIDRFKETQARLAHLFRLIDTVYELKGCIIVTANATPTELESVLDAATFRRLIGRHYEADFTLWDWHAKIPKDLRKYVRSH